MGKYYLNVVNFFLLKSRFSPIELYKFVFLLLPVTEHTSGIFNGYSNVQLKVMLNLFVSLFNGAYLILVNMNLSKLQ